MYKRSEMNVKIQAPIESITLVIDGVTLDDLNALIGGLDHDRNHPARSTLYRELKTGQIYHGGT